MNKSILSGNVVPHAGCKYHNNNKALECSFANDYVVDLFKERGQKVEPNIKIELFHCISLHSIHTWHSSGFTDRLSFPSEQAGLEEIHNIGKTVCNIMLIPTAYTAHQFKSAEFYTKN